MNQTFFSHPLWQKFQGRTVTVCRLSDGEHRLRDAHANILLKEFLPSDTRFETYAIGGSRKTQFPKEGGVIILGRRSLFPTRFGSVLADVQPPLFYHFASDEPSHAEFRSIVRRGIPKLRKKKQRPELDETLMCQSFGQQRGTGTEMLTDNAIVYSGWRGEQPLMLLSGSSTVGTWAAVHYVTKFPLPDSGAIWQQDVQGVIQGKVWADEVYDEVESETVELLSPCRFWLEGGSRPQRDGWTRDVLQLEEDGGPDGMDLRIMVNGEPIRMKTRNYVPTLVLLAWLSNRTSSYREGFCAEITTGSALRALFNFLQIRKDNPICLGLAETKSGEMLPMMVGSLRSFKESKIGKHICDTLKELTVAIRAAGGIAYAEENHEAPGNEARWTFRLVSRELPHFFPSVR